MDRAPVQLPSLEGHGQWPRRHYRHYPSDWSDAIVPVEAGNNDVEIDFTRTRDRTFGDATSLLSIAIFVLAWIRTRPRGNDLCRHLQAASERTQS